MPKAAYNTTADVYRGPNHPLAGAYRFTLVGRLVVVNRDLGVTPTLLNWSHYFNWNGLPLSTANPGSFGFIMTYDFGFNDVLESPPGSGNFYHVMKTETVLPRRAGLLTYRRAFLIQ